MRRIFHFLVMLLHTSYISSHVLTNSSQLGFEIREIFENETKTKEIYFLEIDLSSCNCRENSEECEIAISKSIFMDVNCSSNKIYCCNGKKRISLENENILNTANDDLTSDLNETSSEELNKNDTQVPSAKIRLVGSDNLTETTSDSDSRNFPFSIDLLNSNSNKKCRCKTRDQCPEKYIDYRFGYHCSYDTIRCCEPEADVLKELHEAGRLISPNITILETARLNMDEDADNSETDSKCYCLPREKCSREGENVIWRRQDTLCPADLVQCCGDNLRLNEKIDLLDGDLSENLGPGGYQQPIQLPELKIPLTQEDLEVSAAPTMPPPELPTYYNYQPPKYYSGYYSPGHINPQQQVNHRQDYVQVRDPWSRDSLEGSTIPGNHRGVHQPYPIEGQRSFQPTSTIFDKIANILG